MVMKETTQQFRNSAEYSLNVIQIELVQGCNKACSFCGTRGIENTVHYTTLATVERICKLIEASGHNPRILLAGRGEPTLHPQLLEILTLMRKLMPRKWIQLMTNGQSLRKDIHNLGRMYLAGVNDVTVDEYSDSRFEDDKFFTDEIKLLKNKKELIVNFVRMKPGVPLYAPRNYKNKRLLVVPPIDLDEITMSRTLINHCGAALPPSIKYSDQTCSKIFRELTFRYDGTVAICCQDFRGQYRVTSIYDDGIETLDDIWRHDRLESARRVLFHDKRSFFPCNICTDPALRPGLLPDRKGKQMMEKPTDYDYSLVAKRWKPLSVIVEREWELQTGATSATNLNLEDK